MRRSKIHQNMIMNNDVARGALRTGAAGVATTP